MGRRKDSVGYVAPDHLTRGPAKNLFGLGVPFGNSACAIHRNHGVEGRVDHQAGAGLVLMQRRFDFSSLDEKTDLPPDRAQGSQ